MGAEVTVVGAGPVGLVLAGELAVAGASVQVLERRTTPDTTIKAGGLALPVAAALRRRGLLPALEERSQRELARIAGFLPASARHEDGRYRIPTRAGHFAALELDRGLVDGTDPDIAAQDRLDPLLPIPQADLEALLAEWVADLGVVVRRGTAVTGVVDRGDHVAVSTGDGDLATGWLVGCDGGRSRVRAAMGVDFPGTGPEITGRQAVVDLADPDALPRGWQRTPAGVFVHGPFPGRVLTVEFDGPPADRDAPVDAADLQAALRRVSGVDVVVETVHTATRWTDNARQAASYRRGRLLLAGDAAHVHSPFGGQGLNLGVGDAVNLGWKLAAVAAGTAPGGLLDTYTTERHPVGAAVLEWTRAQVALMRPDPKTSALRDVVARLLATREGMTEVVGVVGGLRTVTPVEGAGAPGSHRLVGRLAPDLRLDDGSRLGDHGVSGGALLATAGSVRPPEGVDLEHVRIAADETRGAAVLLVRPDGLVAWAVDDPAGIDELPAVVDRAHLAGRVVRGARVRPDAIG